MLQDNKYNTHDNNNNDDSDNDDISVIVGDDVVDREDHDRRFNDDNKLSLKYLASFNDQSC